MDRDREFGEFVDARALVMRRTAYLLCGDWHRAEDIVQTALTKLYVAWSRVRKDSVDAYARKVLVRTAVDETRRGFFQRERTVDVLPEPAVTDESADFDLRLALDALPPGQRAVVVLRYWEDLSITETARILGRTEGTVKSQAAKGLAALRDLLVDEPQSNIRRSEVIRAGRTKLARRRTAIASALALVLVIGLGSVIYVARPQLTASKGGNAVSGMVDPKTQLTYALQQVNVIPVGVTVQDQPGFPALRFTEKDGRYHASALLTDTKGTSAFSVQVYRDPAATIADCLPVEGADCKVEQVNGSKVRSSIARREDGAYGFDVRVLRPDGLVVEIRSFNIGKFVPDVHGLIDWESPVTRPDPLLDRAALIKIATSPGFSF